MKKIKFSSIFLLILFLGSMALAAGKVQNEDVKSLSDITSATLTTTGNLSNGTNCITSLGSTAGLSVGLHIYDTTVSSNIPPGTTIAGLPGTCSASQIQMSQNSNATATADTITFGGQISQLINDSKIYVSANGIDDTLSNAISNGAISGIMVQNSVSVNLLGGSDNPGFESGVVSPWVASGGSFVVNSTLSNVGLGLKSGQWTPSVTAQTLVSASKSVPAGSYNRPGYASCLVKTANTDVQFEVWNGVSTIFAGPITIPGGSNFSLISIQYTHPSSGSEQIKFISGAGTNPVYIDQCYMGDATSPHQPILVVSGYYAPTASCTWSVTGSSFAAFATNSSCPGPTIEYQSGLGVPQVTNTNLPQITINNLPEGSYQVVIDAMENSTDTANSCLAINDGTNTSGYGCTQGTGNLVVSAKGIFKYSSASNVTFSAFGLRSDAAVNEILNEMIGHRLNFFVYKL
jgi:hypothetical protein